ncbi:uncharacterized protein LOC128221476 [Mya arenaria]|uniref:uncharacterized protein LOC128221476 n=1 Tax=Mya arenaria TaxID=6604 RepID=UPI0022E733E3|nr:uncharacterized protein LOC128221476 [Mya arenaria]
MSPLQRCRSHGLSGCFECCNRSYCNIRGCKDDGMVGISQRGPFCFECGHTGAGDVCETVRLCSVTEACLIEEYMWGENDRHFITGCTDAQLCSNTRKRAVAELDREGRNVPVCSHCCSTDFCNSNCTDVSIIPGIIG